MLWSFTIQDQGPLLYEAGALVICLTAVMIPKASSATERPLGHGSGSASSTLVETELPCRALALTTSTAVTNLKDLGKCMPIHRRALLARVSYVCQARLWIKFRHIVYDMSPEEPARKGLRLPRS
jgi:hypothetical protein